MKQRDIDIILNTKADWEKLKNTTVLVTGATGRLGIYFVNALLEANRRWELGLKVLGLARNQKKIDANYPMKDEALSFLLQDVTDPIVYDGNIDYMIHTAGLASPDDFTHRPVTTLWGHVQGTRNVMELAVKAHTKKVLYVSTVEIYGDWQSEAEIRESDMGPLDHQKSRACYPEAKRLCETMLECYKAEYGIDFTTIRLSHTFGPGISLDDGRAFAEFMRNALRGEDIVMHSNGMAARTYTYVSDAIGGAFLAFLNGEENYYNIANTDNLITVKDMAEMISKMGPEPVKVRFDFDTTNGLQYLPFKLGVLDPSRIRALGWEPAVSAEEAFRWTIESFMEG